MRSRRRWLWLGAATLLFGLAAYLMAGAEETEAKPEVKVAFPTRQTSQERQRANQRRTLFTALAAADPDVGKRRLRPSDPVLAALPPKGKGASAVVLEANAIRNSPVGQLLVDCLRAHHGREDPFDRIKSQTGVDVNRDLDRMAVTSDGLLLSGNFQNAQWDSLLGANSTGTSYGNQGTIYELPGPHGSPQGGATMARWGSSMMIMGDSTAEVQTVIDRLEGRAPDAAPVLNESDTYGDVYGAIDPEDLASMLPADMGNVADQLKAAAQQVKLHVDATNDVAMVADVSGPDSQQVSDLAKTMGGALSLARLHLPGTSDEQQILGELLDQAKVDSQDGSFRVEVALPLSLIQKHLGWCRDSVDGGATESATAAPSTPPSPGPPADEGRG